MDLFTELLYRVGPLVVFTAVFTAFVYVVTQRPFEKRSKDRE